MALFSILISPLNAFPWVINGLMEAWVSTKRIQAFLKLSELDLDQYYADVANTMGEEYDQASNACSSPGADSQHNEAFEKKSEVGGVTVTVTPTCDSPGSTGPGPTVSGTNLTVNNKELHVRDHGVATSPHSPSWDDRHGYFQGSPAVRGGRRRNRVVVVRNGCFTWTRRDGERAEDPHDDGGSGREKKEEEREERNEVTSSKVDSVEVPSPVEWTLSDLNFTIYSVSVKWARFCGRDFCGLQCYFYSITYTRRCYSHYAIHCVCHCLCAFRVSLWVWLVKLVPVRAPCWQPSLQR